MPDKMEGEEVGSRTNVLFKQSPPVTGDTSLTLACPKLGFVDFGRVYYGYVSLKCFHFNLSFLCLQLIYGRIT